jgi:hypothetical protein
MESYTLKTKTLYSKVLEEVPDPLVWKPQEILIIKHLKQSLDTTHVLALTSLEKLFDLFFSVDKETPLGVLTQEHGGNKQPIVYLPKILDPVT